MGRDFDLGLRKVHRQQACVEAEQYMQVQHREGFGTSQSLGFLPTLAPVFCCSSLGLTTTIFVSVNACTATTRDSPEPCSINAARSSSRPDSHLFRSLAINLFNRRRQAVSLILLSIRLIPVATIIHSDLTGDDGGPLGRPQGENDNALP